MQYNKHLVLPFLVGLLVGGGVVHLALPTHDHHHDQHPIADPYDDEYHVHADFHIRINGTLVDLSGDKFQTTNEQEFHEDLHLHDNDGDVLHIHRDGGTFVEFLASLGIELTDTCITLDNQYCANEVQVLHIYVNDEQLTTPLHNYTPVDDDRILVYYGPADPETITEYQSAVPTDACYYSGTCPERGVAPPESCGLTCEL